jgi:hypothetical protein
MNFLLFCLIGSAFWLASTVSAIYSGRFIQTRSIQFSAQPAPGRARAVSGAGIKGFGLLLNGCDAAEEHELVGEEVSWENRTLLFSQSVLM